MRLFKQKTENKVGLYSTLIFHLIVLIILLAVTLHSAVNKESSFVLDFTKQEQREKEIKIEQIKEQAEKEIEKLLASPSKPVRNVAVDANERLKDDRNKNPKEVYDNARDLQKKLDAAKRKALALDKKDAEEYVSTEETNKKESNTASYSGPSVISYKLDGRKAQYLPVPAYKGYGSGNITVIIFVNRKGRVVDAKIAESASVSDASLRDFAIVAAKRSRFTSSDKAPDIQQGEIVYRFIGQ